MVKKFLLLSSFLYIFPLLPMCCAPEEAGRPEPTAIETSQCCICSADIDPEEIVNSELVFGCKHPMHDQCLANWMLTNLVKEGIDKTRCPYCRSFIRLPLPTNVCGSVKKVATLRNYRLTQALVGTLLDHQFELASSFVKRTEHDMVWEADRDLAWEAILINKNLDAAGWLMEHCGSASAEVLSNALKRSLKHNDLETAEWLLTIGGRKAFKESFWSSVKNIDAAKLLWRFNMPGRASALSDALGNRDFEQAELLASHKRSEQETVFNVDGIEIADWLFNHKWPISHAALGNALRRKNLELANWLLDHYSGEWLAENRQDVIRASYLEKALANDDLMTAEWVIGHPELIAYNNIYSSAFSLLSAGNSARADWLFEHKVPIDDNPGYWQSTTVVKWLINHNVRIHSEALKNALWYENFNVADLILSHGGSISDELWAFMVQHDKLAVVEWLFEKHRDSLSEAAIRKVIYGKECKIAQYLYEQSNLSERISQTFEQHPILAPAAVVIPSVLVVGSILGVILKHIKKS